MENNSDSLIAELREAIGHKNVLTGMAETLSYRTGYRIGEGNVLAVARPATLLQLWRTAELCAAADVIMIIQAANTGLTGGSTPDGIYDRPIILISTLLIAGVIPILDGTQSICLAGATLTELEEKLRHSGRVPHSVIGSSCIGASVVGGICNNSGGALVNRGPAFTRFSLFARINAFGRLELINNLGISLGEDPISILSALDAGKLSDSQVQQPIIDAGLSDYEFHVRDVSAATPARFNADSRCLFEAAGSAGKVIVFAVRVDSFPAPDKTATFLLATDRAEDLTDFRSQLLTSFSNLPVTAEYLHCDAARMAARYGNDVCLAIRYLGAGNMPLLFSLKSKVDRFLRRLGVRGRAPSDHILQAVGRLAPHPLPRLVRKLVDSKEHLMLVTMADAGIDEVRLHWKAHRRPSLTIHECQPTEAASLQRLRFSTAGAMIRFCDVDERAGPLVAIDCALPRNACEWRIPIAPNLADQILIRAEYGHFFCHVFHLDIVLRPGVDGDAFEAALVSQMHAMGIECPAEHNFGHHYPAPANVVSFYRQLDPTNSLNPGIGRTSKSKFWR